MPKKIILTSGGTAGHIWPILAVAKEIKKQNSKSKFLFVGSKNGVEATLVPQFGLKFSGILAGKLRRYWSWENLIDPFKSIIGFFQSILIIIRFKPDIIFAKGGYVSFPVGLAAWVMRKKIIIHESDSVLGLTNKILSIFAKKICVSFPKENYPKKYHQKMIYTGLPVRNEILAGSKEKIYADFDLNPQVPLILVTGGSQGAHDMNVVIARMLTDILNFTQVIHLTGKLDFTKLKLLRQKLPYRLQSRYRVIDFVLEGMGDILKAADLVISRAGATTIAELAALGKPAILIPLPTAAANHQEKNAEVLRFAHAALIIYQEDLSTKVLIEKIKELLDRPAVLEKLSDNIANFYLKDSAQKIAQIIGQ